MFFESQVAAGVWALKKGIALGAMFSILSVGTGVYRAANSRTTDFTAQAVGRESVTAAGIYIDMARDFITGVWGQTFDPD